MVSEGVRLVMPDVPYNNSGGSFNIIRMWRRMPRNLRKFCFFLLTLVAVGLVLPAMMSAEAPSDSNIEQFEVHLKNRIDNVDAIRKMDDKVPEGVGKPVRTDGKITFSGPANERQAAVTKAFQHAWKGYKEFAWGHDQLKPQSHGHSDWFDTGLTIVDSLDTAIIMGLTEEVAEGTKWIVESLSFDKDRYVNLFEVTIRVLGGLLSAFHLTGEKVFLDKSVDLGNRLTGAFTNSKSAVPLSDINLKTMHAKGPSWSDDSSLSEVTTIQLEFRDLSRLSGNSTYESLAMKVSEHVHTNGCKKHKGLCPMYISAGTGKFKEGTTITFGARADSYYEYLLKQWLQTGKTIDWLREDYSTAMSSMDSLLARHSEPNKLLFVGELIGGDSFSPKMDHLVCFLSGTLALGTQHGFPERHMEIAAGLAEACHAMYETPTGLAPEIAYFNMLPGKLPDVSIKPLDAHCLLRPEAIEAWFYMYRITGDKKYQEWGWSAFQAIEKYARLSYGYSSVNSVKKIPVTYRDLMESFFLAETLKYLYLLFDDTRSLISLKDFVFNTEGHPLPIYNN